MSKVIEAALLKAVFPGRPLALVLGLSTAFAIGIVGHMKRFAVGSEGEALRRNEIGMIEPLLQLSSTREQPPDRW